MLVSAERKVLEQKRSAESKARRRSGGKRAAEDVAKAIQRTPAGKKAAETLKAKRKKGQKKEQANYQKIKARAAPRLGGRRKQIHEEFEAKVEE